MGDPTLKERLFAVIKHAVYRATLPVYLWSIGFKTLDEYAEAVYEWEHGLRHANVESKGTNITSDSSSQEKS